MVTFDVTRHLSDGFTITDGENRMRYIGYCYKHAEERFLEQFHGVPCDDSIHVGCQGGECW